MSGTDQEDGKDKQESETIATEENAKDSTEDGADSGKKEVLEGDVGKDTSKEDAVESSGDSTKEVKDDKETVKEDAPIVDAGSEAVAGGEKQGVEGSVDTDFSIDDMESFTEKDTSDKV